MIGNIRPMGEYDIRHFYSNLSNKLLTLSCPTQAILLPLKWTLWILSPYFGEFEQQIYKLSTCHVSMTYYYYFSICNFCKMFQSHTIDKKNAARPTKNISRVKSQSQYWSEKSQLDFFPKSFSPMGWWWLKINSDKISIYYHRLHTESDLVCVIFLFWLENVQATS